MSPQSVIERGDEGHSLLESVVALALLLALIVPAGGALAVLFANRPAADFLEAAAHVENGLEDALMRKAFSDSTWSALDGRIEVYRSARPDEGLVRLSVRAHHSSSGREITALHTIALDPDR